MQQFYSLKQRLCSVALFCAVGSLGLMAKGTTPDGRGSILTPQNRVKVTSWCSDNGNGTYTNPLFYDEFSDPDIIRVGNDYYLAGTTMHCTPGVVILHSRDLVNWSWESYCFERFDEGDLFSLNKGKEAYGQGIWAPCIRYHNGKFYVFSNINGLGLQVFIADKSTGPWKHINMGGNIYDLSVLFDDDGRIYAIHGYDEVKATEIKPDFSGFVEGSERVIIPKGNAMGEGHHIYKIKGKYYIISADYSPMGRMQCARADRLEGPYETTTICAEETMGTQVGHSVSNVGLGSPVPVFGQNYKISKPDENYMGCATLHQGGIVDLPNGDWWGISMQDFRSVGRTVCLSPVTWQDGWPYFGLPKNLGRVPRTCFKPATGVEETPHAPYVRSDNFNGRSLQPIWQWNHNPVDSKWKHAKGKLMLQTMPAKSFLWASNTLTQRIMGPQSDATVLLDFSRLKDGDVAGLALLNMPYEWIGISKDNGRFILSQYDDNGNKTTQGDKVQGSKIYLRCTINTDVDSASLSYSWDGKNFSQLGATFVTPYQLKTFQGPRFSLFAFNTKGQNGGTAIFDDFTVEEPLADRSANLPVGKTITLKNLANSDYLTANPHGPVNSTHANADNQEQMKACTFRVIDQGQGRVALEALNGTGYLTVVGAGLSADVRMTKDLQQGSSFLWQDMLHHQCMLLSLKTQRYIGINATTGAPYAAYYPGTTPSRKDGTVFEWTVSE
jgi:xylan 1,4-beta-xylosidase